MISHQPRLAILEREDVNHSISLTMQTLLQDPIVDGFIEHAKRSKTVNYI